MSAAAAVDSLVDSSLKLHATFGSFTGPAAVARAAASCSTPTVTRIFTGGYGPESTPGSRTTVYSPSASGSTILRVSSSDSSDLGLAEGVGPGFGVRAGAGVVGECDAGAGGAEGEAVGQGVQVPLPQIPGVRQHPFDPVRVDRQTGS